VKWRKVKSYTHKLVVPRWLFNAWVIVGGSAFLCLALFENALPAWVRGLLTLASCSVILLALGCETEEGKGGEDEG